MQQAPANPLSEFQLTVAKLVLELSHSWEVPPVADRALSKGVYCEALAELASLTSPIMSDVMPLVERAMKELELTMPSRADAAWLLTKYCMERIVKSEEGPFNALDELHQVWNIAGGFMPEGDYVGHCLDIGALVSIYWCYTEPNENYYKAEKRLITNESERRAILDTLARREASEWLVRNPRY